MWAALACARLSPEILPRGGTMRLHLRPIRGVRPAFSARHGLLHSSSVPDPKTPFSGPMLPAGDVRSGTVPSRSRRRPPGGWFEPVGPVPSCRHPRSTRALRAARPWCGGEAGRAPLPSSTFVTRRSWLPVPLRPSRVSTCCPCTIWRALSRFVRGTTGPPRGRIGTASP